MQSSLLSAPSRSRDHDDVAGLQRDVLLAAVADGAVVVEPQALGLARAVLAEDDDLAWRGEVLEAAGQRQRLHHGGGRLELQHAGLQIGRASCRERGKISVVAESLKKKKRKKIRWKY